MDWLFDHVPEQILFPAMVALIVTFALASTLASKVLRARPRPSDVVRLKAYFEHRNAEVASIEQRGLAESALWGMLRTYDLILEYPGQSPQRRCAAVGAYSFSRGPLFEFDGTRWNRLDAPERQLDSHVD